MDRVRAWSFYDILLFEAQQFVAIETLFKIHRTERKDSYVAQIA